MLLCCHLCSASKTISLKRQDVFVIGSAHMPAHCMSQLHVLVIVQQLCEAIDIGAYLHF